MANIATIKLNINEKIYLRDPEQTELGKKIVDHSVKLIDEIGFEKFTFKKLAERIGSTEASVYRYFENKHKLLVYLVNWYWSWLQYQIDYQTNNVEDKEKSLLIAIRIVSETSRDHTDFEHIDKNALHRIVLSESSKSYYTKEVDEDNAEGFFKSYKSLCKRIANIIQEINPDYPYPHTLISTVLESAHQQVYFAQHLPSLTNIKLNGEDYTPIFDYLKHLVFTQIKQ